MWRGGDDGGINGAGDKRRRGGLRCDQRRRVGEFL